MIPARLGSKRLAQKNLAPLGGRPLIEWTIEAARDSGVFDAVYVSTEAEKIAEVARRAGATLLGLRPADLAGDTVTNVDVSLHLHGLLAARGAAYDAVVCLQPSSPLRTAGQIAEAWRAFEASGKPFLMSATKIDPHFFHWALTPKDGGATPFFGDRFKTVRQNLPAVYRPNGAIKIATVEALAADRTFLGDDLAIYEMSEATAVHVATAVDLAVAEALRQR